MRDHVGYNSVLRLRLLNQFNVVVYDYYSFAVRKVLFELCVSLCTHNNNSLEFEIFFFLSLLVDWNMLCRSIYRFWAIK